LQALLDLIVAAAKAKEREGQDQKQQQQEQQQEQEEQEEQEQQQQEEEEEQEEEAGVAAEALAEAPPSLPQEDEGDSRSAAAAAAAAAAPAPQPGQAAAPVIVFPQSQVPAASSRGRRRMSVDGKLSPQDAAVQRLEEAAKFALSEFGPTDPRYREVLTRLQAAKQQQAQRRSATVVEPEPEPEPEQELELEPEMEPRDPDEYSRELLTMASTLEASEWNSRVTEWSASRYERTSIGRALTQLRTQNSELAEGCYMRLGQLLNSALRSAHLASDAANAVILMNMINTFSLEGTERTLAKEGFILANDCWSDPAFWEAATTQMIAAEEQDKAPMLAAMDEADAAVMRQNLRFGTVSNVVQQMLDFQMDKKKVREWVVASSKRKLITDRTHLDQLVTMVTDVAQKKKYRSASPDMPSQPKTWAERASALEPDSPEFRQQMRDKEAIIERFGEKIEMMTRLVDVYANSHKGLSELCDFVETELDEETSDSGFSFVDVLRSQQRGFEELEKRLKEDLMAPMMQYYTEEVVSIKVKKKRFEHLNSQVESETVKFLSLKSASTAAVLGLAKSQLKQQEDNFEVMRFDTDATIAEVESNRSMFWQQHLAKAVDIHSDFHSQSLASLAQSDALDAVKQRIKESETRRQALIAEREERKQLLLQSTQRYKNDQTETVAEGWLEKQPFNLGSDKKKLTKSWERRYFVFKSDGLLSYYETEDTSEPCSAPVDFNLVTEIGEVTSGKLSALRKKSAEEAASKQLQFEFNGHNCLLKADTQVDRTYWMQKLQGWVAKLNSHDAASNELDSAAAGAGTTSEAEPPGVSGAGLAPAVPEAVPPESDGIAPGESADPNSLRDATVKSVPSLPIESLISDQSAAVVESPVRGSPRVFVDSEDPEVLFARDFATALHKLVSELKHDGKKTRAAYVQLLRCMNSVVSNPTDTKAKTVSYGNEDAFESLLRFQSGPTLLELLGFTEKRYSMSVEDRVLEHLDDYPDMSRFALAWFIMVSAVADAGMTDKDLDKHSVRLEFPATVAVPTTPPAHRTQSPVPVGLDSHLETFLFRRESILGVLQQPKKHWASLSGNKLRLFADWNKPLAKDTEFDWTDEIELDGVVVSVDPANDLNLRHCFRIATPCRPERALLQCTSEEEFDLWLGYLGRLVLGGLAQWRQ
jgi:hypothetical protein